MNPYVRKGSSVGRLTTSAIITAYPHSIQGALVFTDGTNDATLTLYDNASGATGVVLLRVEVAAAELMGGVFPPFVINAGANGIYAELSGTGASYIIYV